MSDTERAFDFLQVNDRPEKPRERGITEVRGPYYDPMGKRELRDLLETFGPYIDIYKFGGGMFRLLERERLIELIDVCHEFDVLVSTGGYIETVLVRDNDEVERYVEEAADVGFDIVELSSGFLSIDAGDMVALTELVVDHGLKAKPEVGVQFGAGGTSSEESLEEAGTIDPSVAIREANRHLEAGAYKVMIEGEGITEGVPEIRSDVAFEIAEGVGTDDCVFEAPERDMFEWFVVNFGPNVNLFVDASQIVELECMRSGLWGKKDTWGRIASYSRE